ncbi:protein translocase subunit SecF [Desulfurobacterium atlanticum]|uniref:Protein-export membrane protein SecF n=1 Tax=Desulfurobacterium atlanticum TaxID=240169 RepID=A0A238XJA0_9BACT|nr:protein translocase subunit SecF [Desulfurobacterium atlanticum]SNR59007.1 protein translocase subunit secF [Desulfurobacterium atlanticum]
MEKQFDFIGKRYIAYLISILLIVGSWGYGLYKGPKFGIDFTGGVLVQIKIDENVSTEKIRQVFKNSEIAKGLTVQKIKGSNEFILKVPAEKDPNKLVEELKLQLKKVFKDGVHILRIEMIGPAIGKELREKGLLAVVYSMIAILIYVAWRFEPVFAVTSVLALLHDSLITVGMLMATGREFNLPVVAAVLTIIGYSINDTIVVFDRIRENMKKYKNSKPFEELVNESINQTLSRTVITALTTFFVVLCLFLFGGSTINNFSFALLVGIVVGTYSSIFIASSLVVDWYRIRHKG